jgi:predicted dehydrogenase
MKLALADPDSRAAKVPTPGPSASVPRAHRHDQRFPVFKNQPFLRELEQFILTDLGSHTLDTARFLFGEADTLCCQTRRVHRDIKGEDVATVMMQMDGRTTVLVEMAYAENFLERDRFPETFIFVEGDKGSAEIGPDFWLRVTTRNGTHARRVPPPRFPWANPAYDVVHASIVPCNAHLLGALRGTARAETTGEDNLKTMQLVFAAYESAPGRCGLGGRHGRSPTLSFSDTASNPSRQ